MSGKQDDNRPHIALIGGGVAGCSLAYALSRYRVKVTLLEAGRIAQQGASSVPVALLNPHRGRTARASALDLAGLAAMHRIAAELNKEGLAPGIQFPGVLRIASNEKQAKKWRDLGATRWLEAKSVPAPYHAPFGALFVEGGGWLEPAVYLAALVQSAKRRGATLTEGSRVEEVTPVSGKYRVTTTEAELLADKVVLCVGSDQRLKLREALPEVERLAGDVIGLETDPITEAALPYPIAGAVYGAQKGSTMFVGGNHRPEARQDPDALERLRASSGWFVKALKSAAITYHWTGVRAKRGDNQPLTVELAPGLWFYGALAGRGFLCSGHLSHQLAQRLL